MIIGQPADYLFNIKSRYIPGIPLPGFTIEGEVTSIGRVPSPDQIKKWINAKCKVII
jgi:hypothetical protein